MPLQWLRTQSRKNPQEDAWEPLFHGAEQSGYATIVSQGQGQPWFGAVCAPQASWSKWETQGSTAVFTTVEDAIAEAVRLGGTEEAARAAWVACEG